MLTVAFYFRVLPEGTLWDWVGTLSSALTLGLGTHFGYEAIKPVSLGRTILPHHFNYRPVCVLRPWRCRRETSWWCRRLLLGTILCNLLFSLGIINIVADEAKGETCDHGAVEFSEAEVGNMMSQALLFSICLTAATVIVHLQQIVPSGWTSIGTSSADNGPYLTNSLIVMISRIASCLLLVWYVVTALINHFKSSVLLDTVDIEARQDVNLRTSAWSQRVFSSVFSDEEDKDCARFPLYICLAIAHCAACFLAMEVLTTKITSVFGLKEGDLFCAMVILPFLGCSIELVGFVEEIRLTRRQCALVYLNEGNLNSDEEDCMREFRNRRTTSVIIALLDGANYNSLVLFPLMIVIGWLLNQDISLNVGLLPTVCVWISVVTVAVLLAKGSLGLRTGWLLIIMYIIAQIIFTYTVL